MRLRALVLVIVAGLTQSTSLAQLAPTGASRPGEILVRFTPGASQAARAEAHRRGGGNVTAEIARTGVQRVAVARGSEQGAIAQYASNPNVALVEPNYIRRIPRIASHDPGTEPMPADTYFDEQWALHNTGQLFQCIAWFGDEELCFYIATADADIDAPEAWAVTKGSSSVAVAIIDSGIDYTHPDLAANYLRGFDFISNTPDPFDEHGHGTHVAGTIAAAMDNPTGIPAASEGVVGVAPNVKLLAYKVCHTDGTCDDFAIQNAIAQAVTDGARVINMSLGETAFSQSLNDAVQDAWAAGLVIVAGAGNNGTTELFYPAAYENVISVAAFDEDHLRAGFSNYGWVDISAPGNVIMSTYPLAACAGSVAVPGDTGCYNWSSGTSMATPHVSGAAALLWSRADVTTNSQVAEILLASADPVGVASSRLDSWTQRGGLNLHAALSYGVVSNQAPVANAGTDQTVIDSEGDGAQSVSLNGTSSSDTDGAIVSFEWTEGTSPIALGASPIVSLPVGDHTLTLKVTDNVGASATDTVRVIVRSMPDTVAVLKAAYTSRRSQLAIEATSTAAPDASLSAYDSSNPASPVLLGALPYNRKKGAYVATLTTQSRPASVLVVSSKGGTASRVVTGK